MNFHSHLPEELFYDDFVTFFKKANTSTVKAFSRAVKQIQADPSFETEVLTKTVHTAILEEQLREDNPLVAKLVLYI